MLSNVGLNALLKDPKTFQFQVKHLSHPAIGCHPNILQRKPQAQLVQVHCRCSDEGMKRCHPTCLKASDLWVTVGAVVSCPAGFPVKVGIATSWMPDHGGLSMH